MPLITGNDFAISAQKAVHRGITRIDIEHSVFELSQFFFRGEVSYVQANNYTAGDVFGKEGINNSQVRGAIGTGVLF